MELQRDRVSRVVQVARVGVEITVIGIEGDDIGDEVAAQQAIEEAQLLPDAWIDALQDLGLTHLSERLDGLAAGSPPLPSDRVLFDVERRPERKP